MGIRFDSWQSGWMPDSAGGLIQQSGSQRGLSKRYSPFG